MPGNNATSSQGVQRNFLLYPEQAHWLVRKATEESIAQGRRVTQAEIVRGLLVAAGAPEQEG